MPLRKLLPSKRVVVGLSAAPRPAAPRYTALTRIGGARFCLLGSGQPDLCVEIKGDLAGIQPLSTALDAAGCQERDAIVQALVDWRRHYTNRLWCIFTFYGLPFMAIPGHKAEEDLMKATTTAARCLHG